MMALRLDVIEEAELSYEIPYLTGKGEVIDSSTVCINERRQGINISYALVECTEEHVDSLFPPEGVNALARMTKRILRDLEMKPARIILQLREHSPGHNLHSLEGRAPVNKQRDSVLIIITKPPFIYKFGHELVLWHQAMHAKDRWEYRFPSAHPLVDAGEWLDALWHFSIDGRLEGWRRPHYPRTERLEEATIVLQGLCPGEDLQARVGELCDRLWGKETTFAQLLDIGKELGLEPAAGLQKLVQRSSTGRQASR